MGILTDNISKLRNDPRLLKIPPYLSLLCMLGGVVWVLLLPLNEYSRKTYVSENALLPAQVHTYFGGSEQNVFRAYKHELGPVLVPPWTFDDNGTKIELPSDVSEQERNAKIHALFKNAGLKTAEQAYSYASAGQEYRGTNVYAVLHAPRGDATEAIVLVAAIRNIEQEINLNGVTLLISLSRYFKRWSLWSKDIIFLVTPDSTTGPQAWIDAYHSTHDPERVEGLPLKSGSLQGAICIDYPFDHRFETFHIAYDGINGQLPNLDLINTAVGISSGQMGIGTSIQFQYKFAKPDKQHLYESRVQTLLRGMVSQALGHATGPHSVFMPYHIDAITLTAIGNGWQDEMAFGRTVESLCRSLNNLLEKLHQSFFFYLLMQTNRFVSIGTYLPSAMAVAGAYTIMAIYLWVMSGYEILRPSVKSTDQASNGKITQEKRSLNIENKSEREITKMLENQRQTSKPTSAFTFKPVDRDLTLSIALLTALHLASLVPLYFLKTSNSNSLPRIFILISIISIFFPIGTAVLLQKLISSSSTSTSPVLLSQQYTIIKSLSLLLLGLFLTVLATLNFSLSMFLGILCLPLALVNRTPKQPLLTAFQYLVLLVLSPVGVSVLLTMLGQQVTGQSNLVSTWLTKFAFGWNIWGSWGVPVGVFCIWWPAWTVGGVLVASSWIS